MRVRINSIFFFTLLCLLGISCSSDKFPNIDPSKYLNDSQIDSFKYSIIRYAGKLAGKADHTTKFDSIFDSYYLPLADQHDLLFYFELPENDTVYFALTRIAPSVHLKKVSIGGKLVKRNGSLEFYEESFRTYKMFPDELETKTKIIFLDFIKGKDLSRFFYANSQPEEMIEFPNEEVYYDITIRQWLTTREDPLEPYYHLKNSSQ
jgi:hypothetical protein